MKYKKMQTDKELAEIINRQKMELWICSYGGSGTNWLKKNLKKKYRINTKIWDDKLCHYIRPIDKLSINYAIYIYADPLFAVISQIRRNLSKRNFYKMIPKENANLKYSVRKFFEKITEQMRNWLNAEVNYPILFIKYEKINENINNIFKELSAEIVLPFTNRQTDINLIKMYYDKYHLKRFKETIDIAISEYNKLPDFKILYPKK